jgi:hypothetical protein
MAQPSNFSLLNLVVVHPLVLLSTVDHYNKVAKDAAKKRIVGVLLGSVSKGVVDVTNSYAGAILIPAKENLQFFRHFLFDSQDLFSRP